MIEHENIKYDFSDCSKSEVKLLSKYWDSDNKGVFNLTLNDIIYQFDYTIGKLYDLADKFPLKCNFICENCNEESIYKFTKRTELTSYLRTIDKTDHYTSYQYQKKCNNCISIERQKNINTQYQYEEHCDEDNPFSSPPEPTREQLNYTEAHFPINSGNLENISNTISSLIPSKTKLLYQIYKLQNFNLIRNSTEIFPLKHGEYKTFIWRTLYEFDRLNLINAKKIGNLIYDIDFYDSVSNVLDHLIGELEPLINQTDIELSLLKISENGKNKFFTILEPETDIILKAGKKYEFIARPLTDKSMLLRIINLDSETTNSDNLSNNDNDPFDISPQF